MLDELHVTNFGVIEDLSIRPGPGMTVISGETGAGKTLIVGALSVLGGQRAEATLIRSGAMTARAEARFRDASDRETILARQLSTDDPSRAYINGAIARVADLANASLDLFHIYGQHDAQVLLSPSAQAATLDSFCSIGYGELMEVKHKLAMARERLRSLGGDDRSRQRELSICQSELEEIASARIEGPEEELHIREELELLSHALDFRMALEKAHSLLIEAEELPAAMDQLGEARRVLANTGRYLDAVDQISNQIESLRETGREIRSELERLDPDPGRLERLQNRLFELSKLKRKYGDTLFDVLGHQKQMAARIEELLSYETLAAGIEEEIEEHLMEITRLERRILEARKKGATELAEAVIRRLGALSMPNAKFEILLGDHGIGDPVSFMFSSNAGEKLGPVSKVASGGELSRLMLAIRLVSASEVPTMIFDEVDAGVGGRTALSIGKALAELAAGKQVIVVTHLAQVAVFADRQIAISKHLEAGRTLTIGRQVEGEERISELARMLSGHADSEKAREHARELLAKRGNL